MTLSTGDLLQSENDLQVVALPRFNTFQTRLGKNLGYRKLVPSRNLRVWMVYLHV